MNYLHIQVNGGTIVCSELSNLLGRFTKPRLDEVYIVFLGWSWAVNDEFFEVDGMLKDDIY